MCKEGWTPDSITKLDCEQKSKSMHDEEFPIICVGSLMSCCNPKFDVKPSILEPSYVVLSDLHQVFSLALKSPKITIKKGFLAAISSIFNSRLSIKVSKVSCD